MTDNPPVLEHIPFSTTEDLSGGRHQGTRERLGRLDRAVSRFGSADRTRIGEAASLMVALHYDQGDRPGGSPYVDHPLDVALTGVLEFGFSDGDCVVAALLHDSVEDQPEKLAGESEGDVRVAALRELTRRFGARVANLVAHVTNPEWETTDRAEKNRLYREHFREIARADPQAFAIKLADFSTNALRLDAVEETDPARYDKLRRKYCPVMEDAISLLSDIPEKDHPLSGARGSLLEKLREAAGSYCTFD